MFFRSLIITLVLNVLFLSASQANDIQPWVAGVWKVSGVEFGKVSAIGNEEAKPYIGKKLELYKGFLASPFGDCKACGLSMEYTQQSSDNLIQDYRMSLNLPKGYAIVHKLSWPNGNLTLIQVSDKVIYVPLDGAFFRLTLEKHY